MIRQYSQNEYIKPVKVYVDSGTAIANTSNPRNGAYDYQVILPEQYDKIAAVKLVGWNLPNNLAPSFIAPIGTTQAGNNKVDFSLQDLALVIPTVVFSFDWPETSYAYSNIVSTTSSYIDALAQLMNDAIASDPNWGGGVAVFSAVADTLERTRLQITGTNGTNTQLNLLFLTGANARNSAYDQMGFLNTANVSSSVVSGVQELMSPLPTELNPFRYVDIYLKEFPEMRPVERVYFTNLLYGGTTRNNFSAAVPFLTSERARKIERLTVSLRLKNGIVPLALNRDHDLTFLLYLVSPENEKLPAWVNQSFIL